MFRKESVVQRRWLARDKAAWLMAPFTVRESKVQLLDTSRKWKEEGGGCPQGGMK
jgi:hypothetical protein